LRQKYKEVGEATKDNRRLQRLKFFSYYVMPAIFATFTFIYFCVGTIHSFTAV
jgi:hypothetical protein